MKAQRCQHVGCGQISHTGFWCQRCIEQEWPCAALGDSQHWIAWKGVERAGSRDDLFRGALDCPYRIGRFAHPQGKSNWLLSPLGAIKEGYGSHILAAIVSAPRCWLRQDLIFTYYADGCENVRFEEFSHQVLSQTILRRHIDSSPDHYFWHTHSKTARFQSHTWARIFRFGTLEFGHLFL